MTEPAPDRDDPGLPRALQRDLRRLFGRRVRVPAEVDRAVGAAAHLHLRRRRWRPGKAVAAAVFLLALLALWAGALRFGGASREVAAADIDGNGRVDILDAYRLTLRMERREPLDRRWDLDGNGRIDAADADRVARRAVTLGEGR